MFTGKVKSIQKYFFLLGIFFLVLLAFLFAFYQNQTPSCVTKTEEKTVNDDSLLGVAANGGKVKLLYDYYNCQMIKREDVVAYQFADRPEPIIKIVKGLPGDKFSLKKEGTDIFLYLNDKVAKNSKGIAYHLAENGFKMLSLYEKDYKGIIPPDAYLILGNTDNFANDSTRFGLVAKQDILGKIVIQP